MQIIPVTPRNCWHEPYVYSVFTLLRVNYVLQMALKLNGNQVIRETIKPAPSFYHRAEQWKFQKCLSFRSKRAASSYTEHTQSPVALPIAKGGRTRADKIGIGAGGDIVVATSRTQVWCTRTPTKSVSAPARRSVSWVMQSSEHGSHVV